LSPSSSCSFRTSGLARAAWLVALGAQLLVIGGFWYWNHARHPSGNQLTGDAVAQLLAWGRLAGLLAAFGTLLQIALAGRVRQVERAFGFDRLTRLHHVVGFALLAALLAHPVLVTLGHAAQAGVSWPAQFAEFMTDKWEDVAAAAVALGIMLAALACSVVVLLRRMSYEVWHTTHLAFYLAIALAFGHQLSVGSDLVGNPWFRAYWIALYVAVGAAFLWSRAGRPLLAYARHRFRVERLQAESGDVTSVHIAGRRLADFRIEAGQFMLVRFLAKGYRWEAHPFSLSGRPGGEGLRLTIKALGDFTRKIPGLVPGTPVLIDGPHGIFTAARCRSAKALLVAGGIGITPIRALAEELAARGRDLVLLYANRRRGGIVFEQELAELERASGGRLRVAHVLSDDPDWPGEKGRIDRERLERLVPDLGEREVFLCGPPPMMKGVVAALRSRGVPRGRIHFERFAL
jgi:predicted ferric reductase